MKRKYMNICFRKDRKHIALYMLSIFVKTFTPPCYGQNTLATQDLDPVHTIPAEFENGMKFLRLGVAFTRCRYEIV